MERCASAQDKVWARTRTLEPEERHVLSARTLSAWEQHISERARPFCARAKEIRARAGRFARKQGDSRSRIILIYFRATKMRSRHLAVK